MGGLSVGVICSMTFMVGVIVLACRLFGIWTCVEKTIGQCTPWAKILSWIQSSREEKSNLTRAGIYNANGLLIKIDADECSGAFHRFENIDCPISPVPFPSSKSEPSIPPQPLRRAPSALPDTGTSIRKSSLISALSDKATSEPFFVYDADPNTCSIPTYPPLEAVILDTSFSNSTALPETHYVRSVSCSAEIAPELSTNPFVNPAERPTLNPFTHSRETEHGIESPTVRTKIQEYFSEYVAGFENYNVLRTKPRRSISEESSQMDDSLSIASDTSSISGIVKRAISCDSVCSDTSFSPAEKPGPTITGQLCLSLHCYRFGIDGSLLSVTLLEAKDLPGDYPDTYVAIYLSPDLLGEHLQTRLCRGTNCPSYNETFLVELNETNKKLCFHVYNTDKDTSALIGEVELSLTGATTYRQPVTMWLTLTDTGQGGIECGELRLSLSYLPTAERLTLVLVKGRRLPLPSSNSLFVKVYLLRNGRKVAKKRSSIKREEDHPTFNEAFIFSVPPHLLSSVEIRITPVYFPSGSDAQQIIKCHGTGRITLSGDCIGKAGHHWNQMVMSLRKPVTMWHTIRKPSKQTKV